MYDQLWADLGATLPITIVGVVGIFVVLYDAFRNDAPEIPWIAGGGVLAALVLSLFQMGEEGSAFYGHLITGGFAAYVNAVILVGALGSVALSAPYLQRVGKNYGEVHALILFATVGMMVLANSGSLVSIFVGLETMSVCLYVLTGLVREEPTANESALKYFLLGAFSTGFFLYGIALLYGATGTVMLGLMPEALVTIADREWLLYVGLGLLLIGFLFKVSAVPFHMWTPDVYQGAPTTITGFMSTTSKASAFAALILVLAALGGPVVLAAKWQVALAAVAAVTMVVGNVIALSQTNVKRMLAYSSVAHAGYVLTGIAAGTAAGYSGALFYLLAYTLMNLGAFGVMAALEWDDEQGAEQTLDSLAGVGFRRPLLGVTMGVFMFALTGFPPLAGFIGKYMVFAAAIEADFTWLAVVGVVASIVSTYYYLRVLVAFWMRDEADSPARVRESAFPVSTATAVVLVACAVGLLFFGVLPGGVLEVAEGFFADAATLALGR